VTRNNTKRNETKRNKASNRMILSSLGKVNVVVPPLLVALALMLWSDPASAEGVSAECGQDVDGCGDLIVLEDFTNPRHKWKEMNDPVMGGKSTGTFAVDPDQEVGIFHGSVEIVSFLNAPGFIKAETEASSWPDVSTCEGLQLVVQSSTPAYRGFRVSFGHKRPPGAFPYTYGFKTDMALRASGAGTDGDGDRDTDGGADEHEHEHEFQQIKLPFDAFTDMWDAGTGDAVVTCHDNKEYCPDEATLKDLYSIGVWGEGVEGTVDLKIRSISAYGCSSDGTSTSTTSTTDSSDANGAAVDSSNGGAAIEIAIAIEDFSDPVNEWTTMNDPVMGGRSFSSLSIHDGMATFEGDCAIVPFLHAPGFITMTTGPHPKPGGSNGRGGSSATFPDVSSCQALAITVRDNLPNEYEGYYLSFGTDRVPGGRHAMGYKTHLTVPAASSGDDFHDLVLPFSDFSSHWSDATGKTTVTCRDDPSVCPTLETLRDMKTISIWAEGVEGTIRLSVRYIGAVGCTSASSSSSATTSNGSGRSGDEATGMVLGGRTTSSRSRSSSSSSSNTSTEAESSAPCLTGMAAIVVLGLVLARRGTRRNAYGSKQSSGYVEVRQHAAVVEAVPVVVAHSDRV